jgi:hypothetical protein
MLRIGSVDIRILPLKPSLSNTYKETSGALLTSHHILAQTDVWNIPKRLLLHHLRECVHAFEKHIDMNHGFHVHVLFA